MFRVAYRQQALDRGCFYKSWVPYKRSSTELISRAGDLRNALADTRSLSLTIKYALGRDQYFAGGVEDGGQNQKGLVSFSAHIALLRRSARIMAKSTAMCQPTLAVRLAQSRETAYSGNCLTY
jgi:hypothetical protein